MNYNIKEEWRDVKEFEGYYQISNYGRLKSFKESKRGKILKQTNKKGDYFSVVLQANGKKKSARIHRLVAEHFLFNLCDYTQVNHIDGNKQNNHIDNLEWCSPRKNVLHAIQMHPKQLSGMINYNKYVKPRRIVQINPKGKKVSVFSNAVEAGKITGVCARNILQVASKEPFNAKGQFRKTAGGFKWAFESEVVKK